MDARNILTDADGIVAGCTGFAFPLEHGKAVELTFKVPKSVNQIPGADEFQRGRGYNPYIFGDF
jgi:hypothetical protein